MLRRAAKSDGRSIGDEAEEKVYKYVGVTCDE